MWPVIAIIFLSSAPDSAADVAKPDLRLCPPYLLASKPESNAYFLIIRATLLSEILKEWIALSNIQSGKIFNISDKSVSLIIKKYALIAGLDPKRYGGHSLSSGFATSAAESGAEERNIMAMTGHKTTQMVRRYINEANLFKNNALNKIKI